MNARCPDRTALAWAPIGKKSGRVLRDQKGRYAIYTHKADADADCPSYGVVRRVRVRVCRG